MKSLSFPKSLQEEAVKDPSASSKTVYPLGQRTSPPDSALSFEQFSRLLADYRRAGHELAEYWRQTASQQ